MPKMVIGYHLLNMVVQILSTPWIKMVILCMFQLFSIIYSISALGVWSKNSKTVNITYKEEPMIILSDYSFGEDKKELEKALKSDKEKEKMWFDSLIESHKANMQENINMFKSFEITKKSGKTMEIFVGGGYLTFTKM